LDEDLHMHILSTDHGIAQLSIFSIVAIGGLMAPDLRIDDAANYTE
jgi:hypothetical protein